MLNLNLTSRELRRAANLQDKIATLQAELSRILGASAPVKAAPAGKRKMSAAGRARIAAAARARWARVNATKKSATKTRRKMSAAARAKIAAAAKARWKKAKAAGRKRL